MRLDILLDLFFDMQIESGDIVTGHSDTQNVSLIAVTNPGDWKAEESETVGLGVQKYINGNEFDLDFNKEATEQLKADGYKFKGITEGDKNIRLEFEDL